MTTLYKPVLIETAEQAEALPRGTVATSGAGNMTLTAHRVASIAVKPDAWHCIDDLLSSSDMIGWTALVPIEAGKEWAAEFESGEMYANLDEDCARAADGGTAMSRLVTPWEEA